jgi:Gas vesicle synthesis protein GvpL/GvpF
MSSPSGTYIYGVIAADRRPRLTRVPAGLPGAGPVRLLDLDKGLFVAVADLPLDKYNESAISSGLANLDWVSRVAVAHEAVVESFVASKAILPMKLFTIFKTDERAFEHVRSQRARIATLVKRVANQQEWGVRVVLDRTLAAAAPNKKVAARTGVSYLAQKKVQRDASRELASRARETVASLFDRLAARSGDAKRRSASELPAQGGPLLLDAAFLVPRARATVFKTLVGRESKVLARQGYGLTLSGPWPPYTFVQD